MWPTTAKWNVFLYGCKASRELAQENDPGSVWDVDPSLKGPPAVARLVLVYKLVTYRILTI